MKSIDLTGRIFGNLTVLRLHDRDRSGQRWWCLCKCGNEKSVGVSNLKNSKSGRCGCWDDITGRTFGHLTVVRFHGREKDGHQRWWVRCECGTEKSISRVNLMRRPTVSCGCMAIAGIKKAQTTHGMSKTRQFTIWVTMLDRCRNPKSRSYPAYGGRGIKVCPEWNDFSVFWKDMAAGYAANLSIERLDVNGNYEPGNCTWIPMSDQHLNRRPASQWRAIGRKNPTGLRGVSPGKNGRWEAHITLTTNGVSVRKYLGTFDAPEQAAEAFRVAAEQRGPLWPESASRKRRTQPEM